MKAIPFIPPKKIVTNEETDGHLMETFYALEEQIEKIDSEIDEKEKKLIKLSQWRWSETFFEYNREIDFLKHDRAILEKKKMKIVEEIMKKKESESNN